MKTATLLVAISAFAGAIAQETGKLGDAKEIMNNPVNARFVAMLPNGAEEKRGNIKGRVLAASDPYGVGTVFHVQVSGLPADQGPYTYHLHKEPVPTNGNCSATLTHLDPYERGTTPACDATRPQSCEVGDLSGKYGKLNSTEASKHFLDLYASLLQGDVAYFANRSFVIHNAASDRVACANFTVLAQTPAPVMKPTDDECDA